MQHIKCLHICLFNTKFNLNTNIEVLINFKSYIYISPQKKVFFFSMIKKQINFFVNVLN